MACYHPLLGVISSNNVLKKNNPLRILPWTDETKEIYKDIVTIPEAYKNGLDVSDIENNNAILRERTVKINWKSKYFEPFYCPDGHTYRRTLVPCGQCIGCRLDHSREWASRCEMEYMQMEKKYGKRVAMDSCFFVTLTYDNDHVKFGDQGYSTLDYDDVKTFLDNLRHDAKRHGKVLDEGIRYYGAGEYGDQYGRPHYHIIIYGLTLDMPADRTPTKDAEFFFVNKMGDPIYKCDYLQKIWKNGYVTIGRFDWKTAAYTARYVLKKQKGKAASFYDDNGIAPEKSFCSNRPGIGFYYLDDNQLDIVEHGYIQLANGRKSPIPRYFKKRLTDWNSDFMWDYQYDAYDKLRNNLFNELNKTDLDLLGYFEAQEDIKKSHLKKLQRGVF